MEFALCCNWYSDTRVGKMRRVLRVHPIQLSDSPWIAHVSSQTTFLEHGARVQFAGSTSYLTCIAHYTVKVNTVYLSAHVGALVHACWSDGVENLVCLHINFIPFLQQHRTVLITIITTIDTEYVLNKLFEIRVSYHIH